MIEGARYTMGAINHKARKYGSIVPGPGTYKPNHESHETSLRYSMGAITISKEKDAMKSR